MSFVVEGSGFSIKESKFDYFFGRVSSSPHNRQRSLQNLETLKKLGIDEATGGRERLLQLFSEGLTAPSIGIPFQSQYGTTITRKVEVIGTEANGIIEIKYFYPDSDLSGIPEISTMIPKIYK